MSRVEIGNRIKELRAVKNMTREELADRSEISSKFLYEIELGKKGLSADTLVKIANTLSSSCDYIMTGEYRPGNDFFIEKFEEDKRKKVRRIMNLIVDLCGDKNAGRSKSSGKKKAKKE